MFFLFSSINRLFLSPSASYKTKAMVNELQTRSARWVKQMSPDINSRIRCNLNLHFDCPKLYSVKMLDSKLATTTTTTTPSRPWPVCESRHQPPSKLGMGGGGVGKAGVVETCGNTGRADSKTEDEKSHFNQQLWGKMLIASVSKSFSWFQSSFWSCGTKLWKRYLPTNENDSTTSPANPGESPKIVSVKP